MLLFTPHLSCRYLWQVFLEKKKKVYKTPLFELLVVPFHEITVWVFFPLKDNGRIMVVFI